MKPYQVMRGVRTGHGVVPLWSGPPRDGPALLAICGAFAEHDQFEALPDLLPEAEVTVAHLPGLVWSQPGGVSMAGFVEAFRELVVSRFSGRPLAILGGSTGGLVALHLSDLAEVVALDPPLRTTGLWPLEDWARSAPLSDDHRDWYGSILGGQDYSAVLQTLARQVSVIVGDVPLAPRRPLRLMPSLVSAETLDALGRHALVRLERAEGAGHDILKDAPDLLVRVVRSALGRAMAPGPA